MLDGLRAGQQTGVERRRPLELLDHLLALVDEAVDRLALLAFRRLLDHREHLLQAIDLALRFPLVLRERLAQVGGLRRLRHLGQRGEDLLLGVVDVLERVVEEVVEGFACLAMAVSRRLSDANAGRRAQFQRTPSAQSRHERWRTTFAKARIGAAPKAIQDERAFS